MNDAPKFYSIDKIFSRFPKERLLFSPEMAEIHLETLKANRERKTLLSRLSALLEGWMHRKVALNGTSIKGPILEIGAGTLNHVTFESPDIDYDAIEPLELLYENKPELTRIRNLRRDISDITISPDYGRVISIATLEHLTDLPRIIARCGLLLDKGGVFQAGIPSEGGLLWGVSWRISTAIAFKLKTGLDFSKHMTYEHVNDASEIRQILEHFFQDVSVLRFPFPFFHLSLYEYIECRNPRAEICRQYLASD